MPQRLRALPSIVLISLAAACASDKDTLLPDEGRTIKRIYNEHFSDIGLHGTLAARGTLNDRRINDRDLDLSGFVRHAYDELDRHFPRLPNPTLVMYVFPHLAGAERVPIPGYTTTFTLYARVEYALPGEAIAESPRSEDGEK